MKISVFPAQFCSKFKTSLKNKVLIIKNKQMYMLLHSDLELPNIDLDESRFSNVYIYYSIFVSLEKQNIIEL